MNKRLARYVAALTALVCTACGQGNGTAAHEEHHHHHDGDSPSAEIEVTEKQMQTVGVRLGTVEHRYLGDALRVTGELAVNPQDMAVVTPIAPGVVSRIFPVEGQKVAAGQTVALVENAEVVKLQQDYLTAVSEASLAAKELARQEALASQGAGVAKNLQEARTASRVAGLKVSGLTTQLRQYGVSVAESSSDNFTTKMAVKTPISGVVTVVSANTGSYADQSTPLMTIVNSRGVYARLNLFEKELGEVKKGQHVEMQLTNQPGVTLQGVVSEVNPSLDPQSKSASARVALSEHPDALLMPGMALTAYVSRESREVDAVPEGAIASIEGKSYLFVLEARHQEEDGSTAYVFHRVEVTTSVREAGYVEISPVSPLPADAQIVTDNVFYLASMTADHGEHNH